MTPVRLQWGEILMPLLKKYKLNITWGDQDLLNIVFFHNPGKSTLTKLIFSVMFKNPGKYSFSRLFNESIQGFFHFEVFTLRNSIGALCN